MSTSTGSSYTSRQAYIELHVAVLLFGLTAILGDLISLSAIQLVWWRVLITSISLLFFVKSYRALRTLEMDLLLPLMGVGCLVALHWICFYGAIKLANASIALICMATTSVFTALLEPWLMRTRFDPLEILLGLLIVPGMALVVSGVDAAMMSGVVVGFAAAFLAALFGTLNKKYVTRTDTITIKLVELSSAWLFISAVFIFGYRYFDFTQMIPRTWQDWLYIMILALLCTTLAYILSLRALRQLSAYATTLVINLEPLYGIVLAALLLNEYEQLTSSFYTGGLMIIIIVLSYPMLKRKVRRQL